MEFFERNFLGGFFGRIFLGGFFGEEFFGRIFGRNSTKSYLNMEGIDYCQNFGFCQDFGLRKGRKEGRRKI